jgi:hypothetical protein
MKPVEISAGSTTVATLYFLDCDTLLYIIWPVTGILKLFYPTNELEAAC